MAARDNDAALTKVRRRMAEKDLSPPRLAKVAGVSENTVRSFLDGKTWPVMRTMGRLERALGWKPGQIEDYAMGIGEAPAAPVQATPPPPAGPEPIEVSYKGWRFTFHPRPGASPEEIQRAEDEVLRVVVARLRDLGLEDG